MTDKTTALPRDDLVLEADTSEGPCRITLRRPSDRSWVATVTAPDSRAAEVGAIAIVEFLRARRMD